MPPIPHRATWRSAVPCGWLRTVSVSLLESAAPPRQLTNGAALLRFGLLRGELTAAIMGGGLGPARAPKPLAGPPRWARCALCHQPLGGSMPRVHVDALAINYEVQGEGDPASAAPVPVGRPRLLCVPAPGLHRALQLHRGSTFPVSATSSPDCIRPRPMPTRSPASSARMGLEQAHVAGVSFGPGWACTSRPAIRAGSAPSRYTAPGIPPISI